ISDIAIEGAGFNSDFNGEFTVQPLRFSDLTITFEPAEAGVFDGTMTITSNDETNGEVVIDLSGVGLSPAAIAFEPEAFDINGSSRHELVISNEGGFDLEWQVEVVGIAREDRQMGVIDDNQIDDDQNPAPRRDGLGERLAAYRWYRCGYNDYKGGIAWDSNNEWIWMTNYSNNYIGAVDPNNNYNEVRAFQPNPGQFMDITWLNGVLYACRFNEVYAFNSNGSNLGQVSIPGGITLMGLGADNENNLLFGVNYNNQNEIRVYSVSDNRQLEQIGIINNYRAMINNPSVYNIEWVEDHYQGELWVHAYNHVYQIDIDTNEWSAIEVSQDFSPWGSGDAWDGIAHIGNNICLSTKSQPYFFIYDDATEEGFLYVNIDWITVNPSQGTIPGGESQKMFITINTEGFGLGDYEADLLFTSNDEHNADSVVNVLMHVLPPAITVDPLEIDADQTGEYNVSINNSEYSGVDLEWELELIFGGEGRDQIRREARSTRDGNPQGPQRDSAGEILDRFHWERGVSGCSGASWDSENEWMWVTDQGNNNVCAIDPNDNYNEVFSFYDQNAPQTAAWLDGVLYVEESRSAYHIQRYNSAGDNLGQAIFPEGVNYYRGAISSDNENGYLIVHDYYGDRGLHIYDPDPDGNLTHVAAIPELTNLIGTNFNSFEWVPQHPFGELWVYYGNRVFQVDIDTDSWETIGITQIIDVPNGDSYYSFIGHDTENMWVYRQYDNENNVYILDDGVIEFDRWLVKLEPSNGVVVPGESQDVTLGLDTEYLTEGNYTAELHILSNDPGYEDEVVNISLTVAATRTIRIEPEPMEFGEQWIGAVPCDRFLRIYNDGNSDLTVSNIVTESEGFSVDFNEEIVVEAFSVVNVPVHFDPSHDGETGGSITITSNDPDNVETTIGLVGIGLDPPLLSIDTELIEATEFGDHTVTLSNSAESEVDLEWHSWVQYFGEGDQERDDRIRQVRNINAKDIDEDNIGPLRDDAGDIVGQFARGTTDGHRRGIAWDPDNENMWLTYWQRHYTGWQYIYFINITAVDPDNNYSAVSTFDVGDRYNNTALIDVAYLNGVIYTIIGNRVCAFTTEGESLGQVGLTNGSDLWATNLAADNERGLLFTYYCGRITVCEVDEPRYMDYVADFDLGVYTRGNMAWVPRHPAGELWVYRSIGNQFYVAQIDIDTQNWRVNRVVQEFPVWEEGNTIRSIGHDGENVWLSRYQDSNYYIVDDGTSETNLPWVSPSPYEGTIQPGENEEIIVTLSTLGLDAGSYTSSLNIYSNGLENAEVVVDFSMEVTSFAAILTDFAEITFDNAGIGFSAERDITITNEGNIPLVISDIAVGGEGFGTIFEGEFTIEPFGNSQISVSFEPPAIGEYSETLTISSSTDGVEDAVVELSGTGVLPPTIVVQELFEAYGSVERVMGIGNEGGVDLNWQIDVEIVEEGHQEAVPDEQNFDNLDVVGPQRDDLGDELNSFTWNRIGQGIYKPGIAYDRENNRIWLSSWSNSYIAKINPANNYSLEHEVDTQGVIGEMTCLNGVLYAMYEFGLHAFNINDGSSIGNVELSHEMGTIAVASDNERGLLFVISNSNNDEIHVFQATDNNLYFERIAILDSWRGFTGRATVYNIEWVPQHGRGELWIHTINHVHQIDINTTNWRPVGLTQHFSPWNNGDYLDALAHNGENLILSNRNSTEYVIVDDNTIETPIWLPGVAPVEGVTAPDGSSDVFLTFDATYVEQGQHYANLIIASNDPNNPEVFVEVTLNVGAFQIIEAEPETVEFGRVEIGGSDNGAFTLTNTGGVDLTVSDITSSEQLDTDFAGEFVLGETEEMEITVTYSPTESGQFEGFVTIASDDPNFPETTVTVVGSGGVPMIDVTPLQVISYNGGEYGVDVNNVGTDVLTWSAELEIVQQQNQDGMVRHVRTIGPFRDYDNHPALTAEFFNNQAENESTPLRDDEVEWLEWSPEDGVVEPDGSQEITIGLFGEELELPLGDYEANLFINSNDPENNIVAVNILMHVIDSPIFTVPSVVDFGNVYFEDSPVEDVWIYNRGGWDINVSNITIDNEWFTTDFENEFTIQPNDSVLSRLTFAPRALDDHAATLTIFSDALNREELEIQLSGFCYGIPEIGVDPGEIISINDGDYTLELSNTGNGYLEWGTDFVLLNRDNSLRSVRSINNNNTNRDEEVVWFSSTPTEGVVLPSSSEEIALTFRFGDLEIGDYSGDLIFTSNDEGSNNLAVNILLQVSLPIFTVEPHALDFGTVDLETSNDLAFTIHNNGNADLVVTDISFDGGLFTSDFANEFAVGAQSTNDVTINFSPQAEGDFDGTVTVTTNDPRNETETVSLTAICRGHADIVVAPQEIESDNGGQYSVTVTNEGNIDLNYVTELELVQGVAGWITYEPVDGTITRGQSAEVGIDLTIVDMPAGEYEANFHFLSNDEENEDLAVNMHEIKVILTSQSLKDNRQGVNQSIKEMEKLLVNLNENFTPL
ncbi:MAG: choice-of-anchor D domain-containing protein, partial [Calditrichaeota bacterium]|nr:choice-of-anchor D domain-containing protein [Calditrichota bacterium]